MVSSTFSSCTTDKILVSESYITLISSTVPYFVNASQKFTSVSAGCSYIRKLLEKNIIYESASTSISNGYESWRATILNKTKCILKLLYLPNVTIGCHCAFCLTIFMIVARNPGSVYNGCPRFICWRMPPADESSVATLVFLRKPWWLNRVVASPGECVKIEAEWSFGVGNLLGQSFNVTTTMSHIHDEPHTWWATRQEESGQNGGKNE